MEKLIRNFNFCTVDGERIFCSKYLHYFIQPLLRKKLYSIFLSYFRTLFILEQSTVNYSLMSKISQAYLIKFSNSIFSITKRHVERFYSFFLNLFLQNCRTISETLHSSQIFSSFSQNILTKLEEVHKLRCKLNFLNKYRRL